MMHALPSLTRRGSWSALLAGLVLGGLACGEPTPQASMHTGVTASGVPVTITINNGTFQGSAADWGLTSLSARIHQSPVTLGVETVMTVKAFDNFNNVYKDYTGTVDFIEGLLSQCDTYGG